jgi:bifunctional DNase/RNase
MRIRGLITVASLLTVICLALTLPLSAEKKSEPEQEMEIQGLGFDQLTQSPVVLLANKKKETMLPIWIGLCEARSIEIGLSGAVPVRPLTYDMVAAMVRSMNAEVKRIIITDLRDQVYYAQVEMSVGGKLSRIDARPSDAIALAARMESPIFVRNSVIEKSALIDSDVVQREL